MVFIAVDEIISGGADFGRYISQIIAPEPLPAPFAEEDLGVLVAQLEKDPGREHSGSILAALERQFPVSADGAAVELAFYPKILSLPVSGSRSKNLIEAREEGRRWLGEQNSQLLIWGRVRPERKELELRLLGSEPNEIAALNRPASYPLSIPSEFSEQMGAALAGIVAGAGIDAWSKRGAYLKPEQIETSKEWLARLKSLQRELPDALDAKDKNRLLHKIRIAQLQIGAALIANGNTEVHAEVEAIFPPAERTGQIELLYLEIFADTVASLPFNVSDSLVADLNDAETNSWLKSIAAYPEANEAAYRGGSIEEASYLYGGFVMSKLAGDLNMHLGEADAARAHFTDARAKLEALVAKAAGSYDPLSRARLLGYLGEIDLKLAKIEANGGDRLDSAIANLERASRLVSSDNAPRDFVRFHYWLSSAYQRLWATKVDAEALMRSIKSLEQIVPILRQHEFHFRAYEVAGTLAIHLIRHGLLASGPQSAHKGLALVETLASQEKAGDGRLEETALDAAQRAHLTLIECFGHLAAGARERIGAAELKRAVKTCATAAAQCVQSGNPNGWVTARVYMAEATRLSAERTGDAGLAAKAVAIAENIAELSRDVSEPVTQSFIDAYRGAALRTLAKMEQDSARMEEAAALHRSALELLLPSADASKRVKAELELGRTLTRLAIIENSAGETLREGMSLLKRAETNYAAGSAKLRAQDASLALREAEGHLSTLSTH